MKKSKFCQSCGMPLKNDLSQNGTEKNGDKSEKFCHYCFTDGEFNSADEIDTPKKMQKICIEKMTENGMNKFVAWIFTRGIPRLERWNKK